MSWRRPGPVSGLGLGLAAGLLLLALASIGALIGAAGSGYGTASHTTGYIRHVAGFAFFQASLSALLSLALALPVARACWRRASKWNANLLILFAFLPVVMPTTVAATGLIGVWGQRGIISQLLQSTGGPPLPPVYGLGAVLLAHVFFNAPLMLRVLSSTLGGIPQAQWRLAAQWGLSDLERFAKIEWPTLKRVIPGLLALVFLLCFTSFSLVLMLGGGPAVTTLEVSIYTALRFDFDLPMAGKLALLQLMICAGVVILLTMLTGRSWPGAAGKTGQTVPQRGDNALSTRITDGVILAIFVCVTVLPLFAILWRGISPKLAAVLAWPAFWQATFTSLSIAVLSGLLATGIALVLASARSRRAVASLAVWPLDLAISLYLAVSAIVLGTGMFILLRTVADVFLLAPLLVLLGNMLVSLPFAYRILEGRLASLASTQDRLCAALDIRGWRRFSLVTLPALAPEIGYAAGLSSALSLGDMTIVALFGSQQFQTLPWLLYQTMARYRAGEAAALALLLLCLTLLLFTLFVLSAKLAGRRNYA